MISGMEGLQRFFAAGMQMMARFGGGDVKDLMPPEVAEQVREAGKRMILGLMKYTFTSEEIQMALNMMQQMGGKA